jgi:hypothetical protein
MRSPIFDTQLYSDIERKVMDRINQSPDFLSDSTAQSPRSAGDAIENIISRVFGDLLGPVCAEYSADFSRRAMADLAFKDTTGLYYVVDVKTHRMDTRFNMPNLTSVERLARFYESDTNYFVILLVSYGVVVTIARVTDVKFLPIESLGWDCLTIGALGWGQIQIANSNSVTVNRGYARKRWMLEFCDVMLSFYPKEIAKIGDRVSRFEEVREFWRRRRDDD